MDGNMYEELKKVIEQAGDDVNFARYGEGIGEKWIEDAQIRLGIPFPSSEFVQITERNKIYKK